MSIDRGMGKEDVIYIHTQTHRHTHTHTHTHTGILLSHKIEIIPFVATWMELEIIILNEVSQTEKDKYHIIHLYVESKKKKRDTNELIYKTERYSQT